MKNQQLFQSLQEIITLMLWDMKAIQINLEKPYKLVSGNYSPIYINCRRMISSLSFFDVFSAACRIIFKNEQISFEIIAGGETAGIPFAAILSRSFNVPMLYVRKKTKGYGIASTVEGVLEKNRKVLLVEDLITDAESKLGFIESLRNEGANLTDVLVLFDRQQGGKATLRKHSVKLHSITNIDIVLQIAKQHNLLDPDDFETIKSYLKSPKKWHISKGLEYEK